MTGTAKQTFQLTAARRRLGHILSDGRTLEIVSTHSRPKAAGAARRLGWLHSRVFQLTAARRRLVLLSSPKRPSAGFNSQPPEGGWQNQPAEQNQLFGFNSQPPEGGWFCINFVNTSSGTFQLTAARRRLGNTVLLQFMGKQVSTHSRPKAAGLREAVREAKRETFQLTAARRRLVRMC